MAEEEKKAKPNAITTDELKKTKTDSSQLQTQFTKRQQEAKNGINTATETTLSSQKKGLQDAYADNQKDLRQQQHEIKLDYAGATRDTATQVNQNWESLNDAARARNINRGPGSQQSLQVNQVRATSHGQVYAQRAKALEENARQQQLAKVEYQSRVAQAIRNHDYARAAAMLDDYNNQNTWRENQAKILAGFGNFDAYGLLYGTEQAKSMRDMWIAANPELAYNTGVITAGKYKDITGKDAPDVIPQGGGGGGGDGGYNEYHRTHTSAPTGSSSPSSSSSRPDASHDNSAHWSTLTDRGLI